MNKERKKLLDAGKKLSKKKLKKYNLEIIGEYPPTHPDRIKFYRKNKVCKK